MLVASRTILGSSVSGIDGKVGSIADLFFDGATWDVRYLVVDTGTWLAGRKVLLAPSTVAQADWPNNSVTIMQTKAQIEDSPPVDSEKPVSRRSEIELAKYFVWPTYWSPVGGVTPLAGVPPLADKSVEQADSQSSVATDLPKADEDPNLRSAKEVKKYHIAATDGEIGHVEDFIVDDEEWVIRYLVVNTRNWLPGKSVLIAPKWAESIDWASKRLHVDLSRASIKDSPIFDPSAPINRRYEEHLYDCYGRESYW